MTTAMNLAMTYTNEMEYVIWCELHTQLYSIRAMLQESSYPVHDQIVFPPKTPAEEALDACVIFLAEPIFKNLGKLIYSSSDGPVGLLHFARRGLRKYRFVRGSSFLQ